MVLLGGWLDLMILEVCSNLQFYDSERISLLCLKRRAVLGQSLQLELWEAYPAMQSKALKVVLQECFYNLSQNHDSQNIWREIMFTEIKKQVNVLVICMI